MTLKESELHTLLFAVDLLNRKIKEPSTSIIERKFLGDVRDQLGTITCYPVEEGV